MNSLQGKKLLVISSDGSDLEFVKAAHEMGVSVVCCDRYSDWKKSPAKSVADGAWDIDYTDTAAVAMKCREEKIDGVIAGYGEDRVLAACRISNAIGTPFYASEEQIQFTRNKKLFKETCAQCGVSVPKEYCHKLPMSQDDLDKIKYPVIVKPADNGGRKGISVCYSSHQLSQAVQIAQEYSATGEIVVEEYLSGLELCAVYTIVDGEISLSCLNDKYVSQDGSEMAKLCDFVITPSRYYKTYLREVDPGIKRLLKHIGAENGVANFQFIAAGDGIKAFEMGYRINGNNDYTVIAKNNDINFMKMLIHHSLTGTMGDSLTKDNPAFKKKYCTYVVHANPGTVQKVEYSKLRERQNIYDVFVWKKPGDVILATGTNAHKSGMIKFVAQDAEEVIDTINFIRENLIITDTNGQNMCMMRLDVAKLAKDLE